MIDVHVIQTGRKYAKECLDSLHDEPINLFLSKFIEGRIGLARVKAIMEGNSEFVSFVDDDDILVPGTFGIALEVLKKGYSAYYTNHFVMDSEKKVYGKWFHKPAKPIGFSQNIQMHHVVVYRRSIIERVFDSTALARTSERTLFNLASIYHGVVYGDDRMGLYWRVHDDSAHNVKWENPKEWHIEVDRYQQKILNKQKK